MAWPTFPTANSTPSSSRPRSAPGSASSSSRTDPVALRGDFDRPLTGPLNGGPLPRGTSRRLGHRSPYHPAMGRRSEEAEELVPLLVEHRPAPVPEAVSPLQPPPPAGF